MQAQRKTFRLGRHPAKQGPCPLSNNQGRAGSKNRLLLHRLHQLHLLIGYIKHDEENNDTDKQLQLCNKLRLGTWNIRSIL